MTDQDAVAPAPSYFPVSKTKLVVMSLCTFGVYEAYWFYQNWRRIKERDGSAIRPFWRAVFSFIYCHACFQDIQTRAQGLERRQDFNGAGLAVGWILATIAWRLPDPYWLATHLAVLFLLPVQGAVNEINAAASPGHDPNARFGGWNILAIVVGGALLALSVLGAFMPPAVAPTAP